MKKHLSLLCCLIFGWSALQASDSTIILKFNRAGTNAQSVTVSVTDGTGASVEGASATLASSHALKASSGAVTEAIVCPDVNGNTSPTIELTLKVDGLPAGFAYNSIGLDIHALNGASNYQENSDGVPRLWNVTATTAYGEGTPSEFGALTDIDIAAGVGERGAVHKVWNISHAESVGSKGTLSLKFTITRGSQNSGCFFGLSEVVLGTITTDPEPEPDPTPEPDDTDAKVYYIQWKTTGGNHITEGSDHYLSVAGKDSGKAQFWKLIPTGKADCYYIKNVVTGRYIASCNLAPSSNSRIATTTVPVEYYVGKTSVTSGEIAGCHYLSSTDCAGYNDENAAPRALNKDGASSNVITWQAGGSRVGSYWTLVETTDTFVKPEHSPVAKSMGIYFNPCGTVGTNWLTSVRVYGEGAVDPIVYETAGKPTSWHVPYSHDCGQVVRGASFDIAITLNHASAADLTANAYFDWDADGLFETTLPISLDGVVGTVEVSVPETASENPMRMRIRINSNGLDLADDDVEGFVYDFRLAATTPREGRSAKVSVNAADRGTAVLSGQVESYAYGTVLTAKATPKGNAEFVCWREEGVVVSTEAEYTFTVDHDVKLKAYFTANTAPGTGIAPTSADAVGHIGIILQGGNIVATADTEVCSLSLYSIEAALVSRCKGNTLPVSDVAPGIYIVHATTATSCRNVKLYLNK